MSVYNLLQYIYTIIDAGQISGGSPQTTVARVWEDPEANWQFRAFQILETL
jgi:hypothetical protein